MGGRKSETTPAPSTHTHPRSLTIPRCGRTMVKDQSPSGPGGGSWAPKTWKTCIFADSCGIWGVLGVHRHIKGGGFTLTKSGLDWSHGSPVEIKIRVFLALRKGLQRPPEAVLVYRNGLRMPQKPSEAFRGRLSEAGLSTKIASGGARRLRRFSEAVSSTKIASGCL